MLHLVGYDHRNRILPKEKVELLLKEAKELASILAAARKSSQQSIQKV
jgi:hypothetical protein